MATKKPKKTKQPKIETPLPEFLKPIFAAYKQSKIDMVLAKVDNGVVYITVDKKMCGG